jgi:Family of unknown function (DUF5706)
MLGRRRAQEPARRADERALGNEFGWRAHEAIQGWTASVDAKASIALVVQTALAGAALHALIADDGELHDAVGLHLACAIFAVALLVASVACSLWVIFPRLHRQRNGLRRRAPDEIAEALATMTAEEERTQLAQQMWITSGVAWRKHAWLQRALGTFALGAILLVASYVLF